MGRGPPLRGGVERKVNSSRHSNADTLSLVSYPNHPCSGKILDLQSRNIAFVLLTYFWFCKVST